MFDGAVCNYGLSGIDDLDGLLASIARLVTIGGLLVFSLLHPCFPAGTGMRRAVGHPAWDIFHEGRWLASNPGFRGKAGSSHRMLPAYLNALTGHGFVPEQAAEPRPDPRWQQRLPGAAPVPLYLAARYHRQ